MQQPPVRDVDAPERRAYCGEVCPGLPGQEDKAQHELAEAQRRAVERAAGVSFPAGAAGERAQHGPGQAGAERERGSGRGGEQPGLRHERGEDERGDAGYGREAAPGAVQELEPVGEGEAAAQAAHDGEILPVAAHPAVLALEPGRGRGGEAVGELRGAHVAAAQQRALHGVMREDEVVREAGAAAHERNGVDYALAREAAPAREVHPDLAADAAVGVDAARSGHRARKAAALGGGELDAHARVYEPAAGYHAALPVEFRAVERVEHRAYELPRRAGQERRVRVEGEDVSRPAQAEGVAGEALELALPARHQPREGHERPALALVRLPDAVALILPARADKEIEAAGVLRVQAVHGRAHGLYYGGVAPGALDRGLGEVGEQGEEEVIAAAAARGAEGLQPPRQGGAVLLRGEHGADGADGPPLVRDAVLEREARQDARLNQAQQEGVEAVLGYFERGQQREQGREEPARYEPRRRRDERGGHERREGVERARALAARPPEGLREDPPADVRALWVAGMGLRELEDAPRAGALGYAAALREMREAAAIERAAALVHGGVYARGVAREDLPAEVAGLDELREVGAGERAQALDCGGDGLRARRAVEFPRDK